MSDMSLMMRIGAVVDGTLDRAIGGVTRDLNKLDDTTKQLTAKQDRLGSIMARSLARPHANLAKMHIRYEQIGRTIKEVEVAQERLNRSIERGRKIGELQSSAGGNFASSSAQLAGFAMAVGAPINASMSFESAMADVNKTVDFSAGNSIGKLSAQLKELSLQIPLTANELASITASGGQLGVADTQLIGFTETIAKMGVAFDMTASEAGDSMAKLANVYKIPIANISEVGDAINALSNSSPARANEIVNTLGRVGGLAQQFGLTVNEATALSGAFIALGKTPEVAATAINGLITTLSTLDPTNKKQAGVFKQMGLDMTEFKNLVKTDGQAAINTLLQNIEKIPEADRIGALTGLFGREYADDIAALSGGIDTYTQQLQTLQAVDAQGKPQYIGSMAKEFSAISGTDANKLNLFKNNLNVLAITIGNALLPAFNEALTAITPLIQQFGAWAQKNPATVASIVKVVGGLLLAKTAFWGVSYGVLSVAKPIMGLVTNFNALRAALAYLKGLKELGQLSSRALKFAKAIKFVGSAFKLLRVAGMALMTNPIFLAIGLLAGAAFLIYKNWDKIAPYFNKIWQRLKAFAKSGIGNILLTIASFSPIGLFIRAWAAVFSYFSSLPAKFRQYGINIIQGLIGGITAKWGALTSKMSELGESVSGKFKSVLGINSPSRVFKKLGRGIPGGTVLGIVEGMPSAIKATETMAKRLAQTEYSNRVLGNKSLSGMSAGSIQFSPTINVQVGVDNGDVAGQVQQGLNASYAEFERMLAQVEANRQRRAFA